jgi:hypothetical protein
VCVGTYRFWRDIGYAAGAIMAGQLKDALGEFNIAIGLFCVLIFLACRFCARFCVCSVSVHCTMGVFTRA